MSGPVFFWISGMWIFPLIMILVMIFIVLPVIIGNCKYFRDNFDKNSALDILKERYAKGEITKEEFESIKKDILN